MGMASNDSAVAKVFGGGAGVKGWGIPREHYDPSKDLLKPPTRAGALDANALPSLVNGQLLPHTNHVEAVVGKVEIDSEPEENDDD